MSGRKATDVLDFNLKMVCISILSFLGGVLIVILLNTGKIIKDLD